MTTILATFEYEKKYLSQGYDFVVGTDEVGRGPLAGPVVACAIALRNFEILNSKSETNSKLELQNSKQLDLIRDSKMLSEKQRESLFDFIHEHFYVGIGICDHETIDRINILEASFLAMKKAVASLNSNFKSQNAKLQIKSQNFNTLRSIILVDGNKTIPNSSFEQKAIIGGDKIVKSISGASIIAKVTRDRMMQEWHEKFPQYGFDKHKGYGTKVHIDAIRKCGPCAIHRKSFAPVRKAIEVMDNIF